MIEFMDKSGRILRVSAVYYDEKRNGAAGPGFAALSADESLLELLKKLPSEEFLRGPYLRSTKSLPRKA